MLHSNIQFKPLTASQNVLFPSRLDEKIPKNHPVRLISQIVDNLDLDDIFSTYKGGGTTSYHPRMMVKVLFYAYFNNIFESRKIEQALHENIYFMWISGDSRPNFRTINYFRGKRLKNKIHTLFAETVKFLTKEGFVSLDIQYIDGTKIESAANRYTFVWRGSVEKYKIKLEDRIRGTIDQINRSIRADRKEEQEIETDNEIDPDKLQKKIDQLSKHINDLSKPEQKAIKHLKEKDLPRLRKYKVQLEIMGERNSFSKTDTDATFMRMKDDHMRNGQLKPAYNVQVSTENQFVTNFSLHQRPGDTATLIPHLKQFQDLYHKQSDKIVADAGYGSEQNYEFMEKGGMQAFVKYNYFHKEQKKAFRNNPFLFQNLYYNRDQDYFVCPMGQHMNNIGTGKRKSDLDYESDVAYYKAKLCKKCPMRGPCHNGIGERIIMVNHRLIRYRSQAKELLLSEEGLMHRGKRCIEPEAVFGQLKYNNKFNRFKIKGLKGAEVEFGLVAIGHNLRKLFKNMLQNDLLVTFHLVFFTILIIIRQKYLIKRIYR
jgi:transposase